ncbi:MAG: mechanosensitive ion channel family protein [Clostridia bacterium]|nr:mechanosensitive ion channel family protein [Clostridia bacterium]
MDFTKLMQENLWLSRALYSLIAIILAIAIYRVFTRLVFKKVSDSNNFFSSKKYYTYIKLLKSIARYLFILILILVLLKINGVNITSIVTGVGVLGIIFGFAIQDALKDVIKGFDIITDSYYHVGDVIKFENYTGVVLAIGLKTTRIEDIYQKNIVSISNRNIEKVEVLSHMINIDLPLPYDLKLSDAKDEIGYIVENIRKLDKVEKVEFCGVNDFADSSIKYQIKVYCQPIDRLQTRRDALTCILECLEEKDIHIPFNQLDVHQK